MRRPSPRAAREQERVEQVSSRPEKDPHPDSTELIACRPVSRGERGVWIWFILPPSSFSISHHFDGGGAAAGAHDAAAGVSGAAAHVEAVYGSAVVAPAGDGAHVEELMQRHRALKDVSAGQSVDAF